MVRKTNHKVLRRQIASLRKQLADAPRIQLMPLAEKREQVYPVMVTTGTGGFLGLGFRELCFLGVNVSGNGCISGRVTTFNDFLIFFCNYNSNAIIKSRELPIRRQQALMVLAKTASRAESVPCPGEANIKPTFEMGVAN